MSNYLQVVSFSINHSRLSSLWIQGSHPVFVLFLPLFLWGLEPLCDCLILTYISGIRYAHCPIPHSTWQCILWCIAVSPSLLYFSSDSQKFIQTASLWHSTQEIIFAMEAPLMKSHLSYFQLAWCLFCVVHDVGSLFSFTEIWDKATSNCDSCWSVNVLQCVCLAFGVSSNSGVHRLMWGCLEADS